MTYFGPCQHRLAKRHIVRGMLRLSCYSCGWRMHKRIVRRGPRSLLSSHGLHIDGLRHTHCQECGRIEWLGRDLPQPRRICMIERPPSSIDITDMGAVVRGYIAAQNPVCGLDAGHFGACRYMREPDRINAPRRPQLQETPWTSEKSEKPSTDTAPGPSHVSLWPS